MNTGPLYQLIARNADTSPYAFTICVSADIRNVSEAASHAIGELGWMSAELAVITWHDGEASLPVAWHDF